MVKTGPIKTLLIANRGEIAVRIQRTAQRMGIKTVAVYSDADGEAMHVGMADHAVRLGPPPAGESYLRGDLIIQAAKETGAEAIHPGYGFLSENAGFARAVNAAGLIFVGPSPEAIEAMGLKDRAKALMETAGVPITPGYHGEAQDEALLAEEAARIGYPVLIKAVAGGGGKGMRRVEEPEAFAGALASCRREAASSFGDDRVLIEKFIQSPRHIEVQVFGDTHGNLVHLFERDCSLQRRHQKVIEEAPAPGMTEAVRAAMTEAAIKAARAVDYVNAGTVEFIVDGSGPLRPDGFFFMEMNTRLQVEHPVTEMITGRDLVELQLRVAMGEALPPQEAIAFEGHAIEARVYAEDPARGFLPSIGTLERFSLRPPSWRELGLAEPPASHRGQDFLDAVPRPPGGARVDRGVDERSAITPFYDPMIAKVLAYRETRAAASDQLARHLSRSVIAGVASNTAFLVQCLRHEAFRAGRVETGLIDRNLEALIARPLSDAEAKTVAALALSALRAEALGEIPGGFNPADAPVSGFRSPWSQATGWRLNADRSHRERLSSSEGVSVVAWMEAANGAETHPREALALQVGGQALGPMTLERGDRRAQRGALRFEIEGAARRGPFLAFFQSGAFYLAVDGDVYRFNEPDDDHDLDDLTAEGAIKAPMPGKVLSLNAKAGAAVKKGETLLVLEAMKMEHALTAPRDGAVEAVNVAEGSQVSDGDILVRFAEPVEGA